MRTPFLPLATVLAAAVLARATTIHLPADFATIQAGLDAAAGGDTVRVAAGTYSGPGNVDLSFHTGSMGAGGAVVVGEGAILRNCVVSESVAGRGGALAVEPGGLVEDCLLHDNAATQYGGGAFLSGGVMQRTIVRSNSAPDGDSKGGGGVYLAPTRRT